MRQREMKPTGLTWCPQVPAHWEVKRLKYSISSAQTGVWGDDPTGDPETDILCVRVADFDRPKLRVCDTIPTLRSVSGSDRNGRLLHAGDLLLEKSGGTALNPVGFVGIFEGADGPAVSSNFLMRLRPAHGQHSRYWLYAHAASYATRLTARSVKQTTGIQNLDQASYFDECFPYPPYEEQQAIAAFLDRETAHIDELIAKQERLVTVLHERRRALIERLALTGLDGTTRRETGAEWLPAVPAHWTVLQLGYVSETLPGWAFPSEKFEPSSNGTRLLRGVNVKPGRIDWTDTVSWDAEVNPVPPVFLLRLGDLVLGMDRPFVSGGVRIASIGHDDLPALLVQRVLRLRPGHRCDRDYLGYLTATSAFLAYLEPLFTGVSVPHMSEWQVRKFRMPLPPLAEQQRIVARLDEHTAKIDRLIAKTRRFIELAVERRTALITAAVTGKIDVRDKVA